MALLAEEVDLFAARREAVGGLFEEVAGFGEPDFGFEVGGIGGVVLCVVF